MKNRHFGGHCSWILAGQARKCGRFWVFARVPNPGKQSIWRQRPPSARKQSTKKLPNRPAFTHVQDALPVGRQQQEHPREHSLKHPAVYGFGADSDCLGAWIARSGFLTTPERLGLLEMGVCQYWTFEVQYWTF